MYSSVYSHFRHLARNAQRRGRASGSKGKGERAVLRRNNGYVVETKPSAKGSPAPERWPEDDACSSQRFWRSAVCFWWRTKMRALVVFFVWEETNNKQNHQRVPAAWVRASYDGVKLWGSAPLWAEQRLRACMPTAQPSAASFSRVGLAPLSSWIFTSSYKLYRYKRRQWPQDLAVDKASGRDVVDLDLSFPFPQKVKKAFNLGSVTFPHHQDKEGPSCVYLEPE